MVQLCSPVNGLANDGPDSEQVPISAADPGTPISVPAHWLIRHLGDRWSLVIIAILRVGPMRFARLKKALGTVSHRILALSLRKLERDGLVSRCQRPSTPPQVTYALSALGYSLVEQLESLDTWMHKNGHDILAANLRYDGTAGTQARNPRWEGRDIDGKSPRKP